MSNKVTPTVIYPTGFLNFIRGFETLMQSEPNTLDSLIYDFEPGKDNTVVATDNISGEEAPVLIINEEIRDLILEKWNPVLGVVATDILLTHTWHQLMYFLHFGSEDALDGMNLTMQDLLETSTKENDTITPFTLDLVQSFQCAELDKLREINGYAITSSEPGVQPEWIASHSDLLDSDGERAELLMLGFNGLGEDAIHAFMTHHIDNDLPLSVDVVYTVDAWTSEDGKAAKVRLHLAGDRVTKNYLLPFIHPGAQLYVIEEDTVGGDYASSSLTSSIDHLTIPDTHEALKLPCDECVFTVVPVDRPDLKPYLTAAKRLGYALDWSKVDDEGTTILH